MVPFRMLGIVYYCAIVAVSVRRYVFTRATQSVGLSAVFAVERWLDVCHTPIVSERLNLS